MKTVWTALREDPGEAIAVVVAILVAAILAIFTFFGVFNVNLAIGVSLEALAIIMVLLFYIRGKSNRVEHMTRELLGVEGKLDQGVQEAQNGFQMVQSQLQHLENCLEETRSHPYRLSRVLVPFWGKMTELEEDLRRADQVWILSRTCRRLWADFSDELTLAAQRGGLRFLLLDPEGHALGLTVKSTTWDIPGDGELLRQNVKHFLNSLEALCQDNALNKLSVRKIDYLPAWTLILVNPGDGSDVVDNGKAYVEMATYRAHPRKRPCLTISSDKDYDLFCEFREEFSKMWERATAAW
jgi:hypothetical protein